MDITSDSIPKINIIRFLNRIPGMKVNLQNELYDMMMQELQDIISREKRTGRYDMGIKGGYLFLSFILSFKLNVFYFFSSNYGIVDAEIIRKDIYDRKHVTGTAPVFLTWVRFERSMTWDEAAEKFVSFIA